MMPDLEGQIRKRAFEIWEAEGRPEGRHEAHWHQATHEMANGINGAKVAAKPGAKARVARPKVAAAAKTKSAAKTKAPAKPRKKTVKPS